MKFKFKIKKLLVIILVVYLGYTYISQQILINNKKTLLNDSKIELSEMEIENQNLIDEVKMSNTYRYVEILAREKLGLIKEGETVVVNGD
ncbi:FtsB family cell division protein [Clostridium sp. DL1XJH146]